MTFSGFPIVFFRFFASFLLVHSLFPAPATARFAHRRVSGRSVGRAAEPNGDSLAVDLEASKAKRSLVV